MSTEIWKTNDYYPDYEISSNGNIRNKITKRLFKYNVERFKKDNLYMKTSLFNKNNGNNKKLKRNNRDNIYIHVLVAKTFINNSNPDINKTVNHKDGNKYNNNVQNLEWVSHKDQSKHIKENNLRSSTIRGRSVKIYKNKKEYKIYKSIMDAYREINELLELKICDRQFDKLFTQNKVFKTINGEEITGEYNDICKNEYKDEEWKTMIINDNKEDFKDFEISNYGRIRNTKGILQNLSNKGGYIIYHIWNKKLNKSLEKQVHRLVAESFCNIPEHLKQHNIMDLLVDHINSIPTDNYYKNLRWCTSLENAQNKESNKKRGKKVYQYLKNNKGELELVKEFDTITEAKNELQVNFSSISKIIDKPNRKCDGFYWKSYEIKNENKEIKINEKKEIKNIIIIGKYSYNGKKLLEKFNSIDEARQSLDKCSSWRIKRAIDKNQRCMDFYWKEIRIN